MNIRDIQSGLARTDQTRAAASGKAGTVVPGQSGAREAGTPAASAQDRVEISAEARAAATENAQARELGFARKALLGIPPLSMDRAADILQRIQEGFYSQPEVIKQVASEITSAFLADAAENREA
ncbi:MAG: hypothetical protein D6685_14215 [Bacteroidetes bacterium]|nr:MAG: hypothetical protein D6685_14215 [Bacteroidota bacterium]